MAEEQMRRDWNEYLAWTRAANPLEYAATEALAWQRLQAATLRAAVVPCELELPDDLPAPQSDDPLPRA